MPVPPASALGPLAGLIGTWEGDQGIDVAFHNAKGGLGETKYRERIDFKPFGPVDNGAQCLYGLDYRMAAWRVGEDEPFHTEVGYWLWDAAHQQVMRCFMVPRGSTVLAGATVEPDARTFTMKAVLGSPTYGILSNVYLDEKAKTTAFECTIEVGDGVFSYDETTTVEVVAYGSTIAHTDRNTLQRVD
jgi:hypothetical protein